MTVFQSLLVFRKTAIASCLGLISFIGLVGCSAVQVKMGWRVSLAKIPVASLTASLPNNPGIAPGEKSPLVVEVTGTDGKVLVTEGKGKGKILWKDLTVTPSVVAVNKKGVLSLPQDPRVSDGKTGHVTITVPSHPGIQAELEIPLRYNYHFVANFSGASGSNGSNGLDGLDGTMGTPGSMDPDNPSPGGNGSNGTNGSDGSNGEDGGNAPPVQVVMMPRPGSHPLLEIGVSASGRKEHFYLVDPSGGTLTVNASGGAGGTAGKGGRGGRGGSGGIGQPNGSNGSDGSSGHDGSDGSPGGGGSITVKYDPQAKPYLAVLRTNNPGGPSPVFHEAPVTPLW